MRAIIQRVTKASVTIKHKKHAEIKTGLLILLGIENQDTQKDVVWLTNKIVKMRIFNDENNLMNKSVQNINGEILVVSQFTLFASTKKGNRPGFTRSAKPEKAIPLYETFVKELQALVQKPIQTGVFGADMQVTLLNNGPVTINMDTKNKE